LPDAIRKDALDEILAHDMTGHDPMTINSLQGVIGLLKQPRASDHEAQIHAFKTYTLALDTERNQTINCLDQRLAALIND
jgi:hypothetical protein